VLCWESIQQIQSKPSINYNYRITDANRCSYVIRQYGNVTSKYGVSTYDCITHNNVITTNANDATIINDDVTLNDATTTNDVVIGLNDVTTINRTSNVLIITKNDVIARN
jgi:hypothetical protein